MDNNYPPPIFTPRTPEQPTTPSPVPPQMPPMPTLSPMMGESPRKSSTGRLVFLIILLVLVILGGASAFAYVQKIGPFKPKASFYTPETFASSILAKFSEINSSSYKVSSRLNVGPRDAGAKPFSFGKDLDPVLVQKYADDFERVQIIKRVLTLLNQHLTKKTNTTKTYPNELSPALTPDPDLPDLSKKSPLLKGDYKYETTENGKNFLLSVTFDTAQAIEQLNQYNNFSSTNLVIVEGKTIKFTKDSPIYLFIDGDLPKPFFVSLTDSLKLMPADVDFLGEFNVSTEKSLDDLNNWLFGFNVEGDFDDLTYRVNAEALRKEGNYYFKINNIPSLFFLGELAATKGQWIQIIDKNATTTEDSFSLFSMIAKEIPDAEKEYKAKRAEISGLFKKIVEIADQKQIIVFKTKPSSEKVNGQSLIRYDLGIKKEAILSFLERVAEEVAKLPASGEFRDVGVTDTAWLTYLESDEFDEVFDYLDQNIKLTLWTDKAGFPVVIEESFRLVPPASAEQLAGKQINLVFRTTLSDINRPAKIEAPTDAKLLKDVMENIEEDFDF